MRGRSLGTVGSRGPLKPERFFTPPLSIQPLVSALDDGSDGWLVGFQQAAIAIAATQALSVSMTAAAQPVYLPDELPVNPLNPIEYLRPTAWAVGNKNINSLCTSPFSLPGDSGDPTVVFAGKSGAGPTGSSYGIATHGLPNTTIQDIFLTWQSAAHSYSALTIKISASSNNVSGNLGKLIYYSTDSGSTWTLLGTLTGSQATYSASISTSTDLTKLQVVAMSSQTTGGSKTTVYDIWTEGSYSTGITVDDNSAESFWGGVQNCAVSVALGACLAATALSTSCAQALVDQHQDDPAGNLHGQPDEDFWVSAVAPIPPTLGPLYLPDPEEIPAATLHGQPDEDFWTSGVSPQLWLTPPLQAITDDDVPAGSLHGQPDEDYWQNQVAPVTSTLYQLLPIGDPEEIPAGSLRGQPDEDLWVNWVSPTTLTLQWPNPWQFEQNESPTLHGQPDEDLWINPVFPAQKTLLWPQQWTFDQNESPTLHGQPDEDFWINSVPPLQSTFLWPQQWTFENPAFYISPVPPGTRVVIVKRLKTFPQVFSVAGEIQNVMEAGNYIAYSVIESSEGEAKGMIVSEGFGIYSAFLSDAGQVVGRFQSLGFAVYRVTFAN